MTAQPFDPGDLAPDDDGIISVRTGRDVDDAPVYQRFRLDDDDEVLTAVRPKMAIMMKLGRSIGHAQESTDAALAAMDAVDIFISHCLVEESSAYVTTRLDDAEDDLDIEHMLNAITQVLGLWYQRPPTSPPGSSGPRRSPGRRSTVRARSRG